MLVLARLTTRMKKTSLFLFASFTLSKLLQRFVYVCVLRRNNQRREEIPGSMEDFVDAVSHILVCGIGTHVRDVVGKGLRCNARNEGLVSKTYRVRDL